MDDHLITEYFDTFKELIEAKGESLALPPMNSYQRRLIHKLAGEFDLKTSSEGEGDSRHIVVAITDSTKIPAEDAASLEEKLGDQFNSKPSGRSGGRSDSRSSGRSDDRGDTRPTRGPKGDAIWNFGEREFYLNPMEQSIEIILMKDGTVALWDEANPHDFLDKRAVTTGSFKVKQNKITVITDDTW